MRFGWIIAAGVLMFAACGAVEDAIFTHDLLDADFTNDDGTFATGENEWYQSEIVAGRYRVSTIANDGPVMESFGFFTRIAYNVEIEARIVAINATDSAVGLECVHAAGNGRAGQRYVFMASTSEGPPADRASRFGLGFMSNGSAVEELALADGDPVGAGQRIGLHCDDRAITGLVDGEPVVSFSEPAYDSFKAAAVVFAPQTEGDWVEFDDVTAVVPEHS